MAAVLRLTRDLPGFLSSPLSRPTARERLLQRMATREARLLTMMERAIYAQPASPYLALLNNAGCELGDVQALVAREGVEGALKILASRGVYVTYDEMKGRRVAVRGSSQFSFRQRDFDNPLTTPHYVRFTSGSGGHPSRVGYSLGYLDERAISLAMMLEAHGVERARHAFWLPVPIDTLLVCARLGEPAAGWFYPVHPLPLPARLLARYLAAAGWFAGYRFPPPRRCDLDTPDRLLDWLKDQLETDRAVTLRTTPSAGARLGVAATAAGRELSGATFIIGGEPVTEARRRQIEATGARVVALYGSVEISWLSYSCAVPTAADDMHVLLDRVAVVQRQRQAAIDGPMVDALLFTLLTTEATKIALNAETGDYARVEERACGCLLGELGLCTHLSEVRSFEKLTGEGVTFARSSLERVLEVALPARFGGTSLDYQLAEEELANGRTRLILRVSPAVGAVDEPALRAAFLDELDEGGPSSQYQARVWENARTIELRREPPVATRAGKILPFALLGQTGPVYRSP
jgi:hypothetical protein